MEEDDPLRSLGRRLQEAWDDLRTRGAQGLLQLLPFGRKPEVPAWERLARKTLAQVKAENEFYIHAAVYGAGCLFLACANLVTTFFDAEEGFPGRIWSVMAIGGWGIGVVMHGVDALITKRQKYEDESQHLTRLLAEPREAAVAAPVENDLAAMKDRVIRTAEEARGALGRHSGGAAELVSRGKVKALTMMSWIEQAERQLAGQEAERSMRRDVARRVASSPAPAERTSLVDLMSGLDRREQLRGVLAGEVAERRERLSSFLLALEGARLARPEALSAVTAPLGERVALLEAATGAAPQAEPGVTERHERLEEELRLARELQRSILPQRAPVVPSLEVANVYRPCGDVGGDYYDFYQPSESQLLVCLGDASGHGIDSSMVSSMAKGALYLQVSAGRDLPDTLSEINRMMCDTLGRRRLMTMALLCLDVSEGMLSWVNAGQIYPMLLRRGRVKELELPGYPLGVRRDVSYTVMRERLEPGDLLVLFTDGLVEALSASGDIYGWERLRSRLEGRMALGPAAAVESLAADLTAHLGGGPPQDDVTLMAISYRP